MSDTTDGLNIDEKRVIILDAERYFAMTTRIAELESEIARLNATGLEGLERDKAILQGTVWELQAQLATEQEDNDADDEYRHTQMVLLRAAIEVLETEIGRLALVEMDNERLVAQLAETERMVSLEMTQAVRIGELQAQLAQAQAGRWTPVENGYNSGRIHMMEIQIGLDSGILYVININKNRATWQIELPDNLRLCRWQEVGDETA